MKEKSAKKLQIKEPKKPSILGSIIPIMEVSKKKRKKEKPEQKPKQKHSDNINTDNINTVILSNELEEKIRFMEESAYSMYSSLVEQLQFLSKNVESANGNSVYATNSIAVFSRDLRIVMEVAFELKDTIVDLTNEVSNIVSSNLQSRLDEVESYLAVVKETSVKKSSKK
jgi:hypothetical protein